MTVEIEKQGEITLTPNGLFYSINGLKLPIKHVTPETSIAFFDPLEPTNHEFGVNSLSDILSSLIEQKQRNLTVITISTTKARVKILQW